VGIYHLAKFQGDARGFGTKSLKKLQEKVDLQTGPLSENFENIFSGLWAEVGDHAKLQDNASNFSAKVLHVLLEKVHLQARPLSEKFKNIFPGLSGPRWVTVQGFRTMQVTLVQKSTSCTSGKSTFASAPFVRKI